jgi:hypothetical protein
LKLREARGDIYKQTWHWLPVQALKVFGWIRFRRAARQEIGRRDGATVFQIATRKVRDRRADHGRAQPRLEGRIVVIRSPRLKFFGRHAADFVKRLTERERERQRESQFGR